MQNPLIVGLCVDALVIGGNGLMHGRIPAMVGTYRVVGMQGGTAYAVVPPLRF